MHIVKLKSWKNATSRLNSSMSYLNRTYIKLEKQLNGRTLYEIITLSAVIWIKYMVKPFEGILISQFLKSIEKNQISNDDATAIYCKKIQLKNTMNNFSFAHQT